MRGITEDHWGWGHSDGEPYGAESTGEVFRDGPPGGMWIYLSLRTGHWFSGRFPAWHSSRLSASWALRGSLIEPLWHSGDARLYLPLAAMPRPAREPGGTGAGNLE